MFADRATSGCARTTTTTARSRAARPATPWWRPCNSPTPSSFLYLPVNNVCFGHFVLPFFRHVTHRGVAVAGASHRHPPLIVRSEEIVDFREYYCGAVVLFMSSVKKGMVYVYTLSLYENCILSNCFSVSLVLDTQDRCGITEDGHVRRFLGFYLPMLSKD